MADIVFSIIDVGSAKIFVPLIVGTVFVLTLPRRAQLAFIVIFGTLPIDELYGRIPFIAELSGGQFDLLIAIYTLIVLGVVRRSEPVLKSPTWSQHWISALLILIALFYGWPDSIPFAASLFRAWSIALVAQHFFVMSNGIRRQQIVALSIFLYSGLTLVASSTPLNIVRNISAEAYRPVGDVVSKFGWNPNPNRYVGLGGDYELLAQSLGVGIIGGIFLLRLEKSRWRRLATMIGLAAASILLFSTGSIFGMLLTFISISSIVLTGRGPAGRRPTASLVFLGVMMISGIYVVTARLEARGLWSTLAQFNFSDFPLILDRERVWSSTLNNTPATFLGAGFPFPYKSYGSFPHSTFLYFYVCAGVLGLLAFLGWWVYRFSWTARLLNRADAIHFQAFLLLAGMILIEPFRLSSFLSLVAVILQWSRLDARNAKDLQEKRKSSSS